MAAGHAAAAVGSPWQQPSGAVQTLEIQLESLRLPISYAPPLLTLLGPLERIIEMDQSRLALLTPLAMPYEHASRFVGHCAVLRRKRELRSSAAGVASYYDPRWSRDRDAVVLDSFSYNRLPPPALPRDGSASRFQPISSDPSPKPSMPLTPRRPEMLVDDTCTPNDDGPFQCLAHVGQSLKAAFDAFARKQLHD